MLEIIFTISTAVLFALVVLLLKAMTLIGSSLAIALLIGGASALCMTVIGIMLAPKGFVASEFDSGCSVPRSPVELQSDRAGRAPSPMPARPAHHSQVRR